MNREFKFLLIGYVSLSAVILCTIFMVYSFFNENWPLVIANGILIMFSSLTFKSCLDKLLR